jgi:thioesterase domain-containing protein
LLKACINKYVQSEKCFFIAGLAQSRSFPHFAPAVGTMTSATSALPHATARSTSALFARVSRQSERAIVPINAAALNPDSDEPTFYCVHSASGVAGTDFMDLAERLEPSVRFFGIQAPPKQMTDDDFGKSVESLADYYADALVKFQPTGPFLLGGYCVGAVIALAMADNLRARGRDVGPLFVIDGVPENTDSNKLQRWKPQYWLELAQNFSGWLRHADLMRNRTLQSLIWSITNNASAIGRSAIGLKRGQKVGGGYAIDSIMDVSRYQPSHKSFINRLFAALFSYSPSGYASDVVVYEATVVPLLFLPQIGRIWRKFAPRSQVVGIVGTHISMMHTPYVDALAEDMRKRIDNYFRATAPL